MRIAMVCPYALSRPGGVQGQALGLARSLRRAGHEVTVVAPDDHRPLGLSPTSDGPNPLDRVLVVGRPVGVASNGSVAPVALAPAAATRTAEFVRRAGVDVVHLHEPMAPVVGYGLLARPGAPLVATFHRSGSSGWYRALRPLAAVAARRLGVRCAVSEAAAATAAQALGGRYDVLYNGLELERFAKAEPTTTVGPTAVFLGRHETRKGLGTLLEAFAGVRSPGTLWVAGGGPATEALRGHHPESDRLHWLGVLDDEELASRLAGADVLVAPSLGGESFGMVLAEALAARCAVVASDIEGYRAAAGWSAVLVPPGDVAALRTALDTALADAAAAVGRSAPGALDAGVARAARWSMDALAGGYVERYERAIADFGGARAR